MAVSMSTIMMMTGTGCSFQPQVEWVFAGVRLVDDIILYFVRLSKGGSNRNIVPFVFSGGSY